MKIVQGAIAAGHISLFIVVLAIQTYAATDPGQGHPSPSPVPQLALHALHKSQGMIEVRLERLDGVVTYQRSSGFIVDAKRGFIVTSTHAIPQFKAVFKDDAAVSFYRVHDGKAVQRVPAYAYATSWEDGLTMFQLDGGLPDMMGEIEFADEVALHGEVYARVTTFSGAETDSVAPASDGQSPAMLYDRIVDLKATDANRLNAVQREGAAMSLDIPESLFGEMIVDAHGRVIGMGNGVERGHSTITSASTIKNLLDAARQAEGALRKQGGLTPKGLYTINKLSRVFEQILLLHATQALERPGRLEDCAYEMFAMEASGACRDRFSSFLSPVQARQRTQSETHRTVSQRIVKAKDHAPVGVIRVEQMYQRTSDQFREALDALVDQQITKIVIDVRDNPGGSVHAALRMLTLFMHPDDTALVMRKRHIEQIFDAGYFTAEHGIQDFGTYRHLDIVILINRGSASAAEIFAGTLQDWGYTVVGERSFGKGVAQNAVTLHDESMLLLSASEFFVGNRAVPIRERGVQPNIEINPEPSTTDKSLKQAIRIVLSGEKAKMARQ